MKSLGDGRTKTTGTRGVKPPAETVVVCEPEREGGRLCVDSLDQACGGRSLQKILHGLTVEWRHLCAALGFISGRGCLVIDNAF